jgi:ABC-type transporter Mla maintaining outer membrane lipid asymmetry ATPase subunit MlaF
MVIKDVPGKTRLMKVMAKQVTEKVGSVKLHNGCYNQTGSEALQKLCSVHFLDCRLTDGSKDG